MNCSEKIHFARYSSSGSNLIIRCHVEASMKKSLTRYPKVIIDDKVVITDAKCSCVQAADKRCCHIAVVLYLVEDLSLGLPPKIWVPCTSRPQAWGKGSKRKGDPMKINVNRYGKKFDSERYEDFDPRPAEYQGSSSWEKDQFLQALQKRRANSMWEKLLNFSYSDYEVDEQRIESLRDLCFQFEQNLFSDLQLYESDNLSNFKCVHVSGTESQVSTDLWFQVRKYRLTASTMKDWASKPIKKAETLWLEQKDLSNVKSLSWEFRTRSGQGLTMNK